MKKICTCFITITLILPYFSYAQGVYQVPDEFINEVFDHDPPKSKKLWLRKLLKEEVKSIMGHDLGVLRLRYWYKDDRSAWILEEIGKERPITTGIVVNKNKIELVRILIFRESRGWEVRHPFFTDQFKDANLMQFPPVDCVRHIHCNVQIHLLHRAIDRPAT